VLTNKMIVVEPTTNIEKVFPDKLRDLNQYEYKVFAAEQKPGLFKENGKIVGHNVLFLEIVAKQQKAKFKIFDFGDDIGRASKALLEGELDLSLNTMVGSLKPDTKIFKQVNTFDTNGYCAMVPIPIGKRFFNFFTEPFDTLSWGFMVVSLLLLIVIWTIFKMRRDGRRLNSAFYMVFWLIAGFLGQAIPFRHTRWLHLLIIEIFVLAVMILGNAYQSVLISFLTVTVNATRITTVDEMLKGDYNYISSSYFYLITKQFRLTSSFMEMLNVDKAEDSIDRIDFKSLAENNTVVILKCDRAKAMIDSSLSNFKYGKLFTTYDKLMTTRYSPFAERLEDFSMRIFESGIKQHWNTMIKKITKKLDFKLISVVKEENLLKLDDLKYVFLLWGVCLLVACIVLLLEQLWKRYEEHRINRVIRAFAVNEMRREQANFYRRNRIRPFLL
jgi:hypothetical protein